MNQVNLYNQSGKILTLTAIGADGATKDYGSVQPGQVKQIPEEHMHMEPYATPLRKGHFIALASGQVPPPPPAPRIAFPGVVTPRTPDFQQGSVETPDMPVISNSGSQSLDYTPPASQPPALGQPPLMVHQAAASATPVTPPVNMNQPPAYPAQPVPPVQPVSPAQPVPLVQPAQSAPPAPPAPPAPLVQPPGYPQTPFQNLGYPASQPGSVPQPAYAAPSAPVAPVPSTAAPTTPGIPIASDIKPGDEGTMIPQAPKGKGRGRPSKKNKGKVGAQTEVTASQPATPTPQPGQYQPPAAIQAPLQPAVPQQPSDGIPTNPLTGKPMWVQMGLNLPMNPSGYIIQPAPAGMPPGKALMIPIEALGESNPELRTALAKATDVVFHEATQLNAAAQTFAQYDGMSPEQKHQFIGATTDVNILNQLIQREPDATVSMTAQAKMNQLLSQQPAMAAPVPAGS